MSTDNKFYTREDLETFTNAKLRALQKKHSNQLQKPQVINRKI